MRRRLLALAVLVLTLIAGEATTADGGITRYSAETLLAADVPWSTVQAVAGTTVWPELPAFNSIIDEEDPQPLTAVSQTYSPLGKGPKIITRLYAYASPELSLQFLQSAAIVVEPIDQQKPSIGDQHFYFVTTLTDGTPSTRMYFIRGPIGVEIQVDGAKWSRNRIARLANPVDTQLQQVLAGKLHAPALPSAQLALLPAAGDAPGPVLGTASVPAEAWAMIVHKGSPRTIRNELVRSGNRTFPFRRYVRRGSRTDVVEVAAFEFPSTAAARSWFAPFAAGVKSHPADALDPGATGSTSAFRFELENYELRFVAGRYVADVFCYAPFVASASKACQGATRTLAEKWYAELKRLKR